LPGVQRAGVSAARFCVAALLLFTPRMALAQVSLSEDFLDELQENDLTFNETDFKDFAPAPIVDNPDMNYELAARSPTGLEVRYAIRRFDPKKGEPTAGGVEAIAKPMFETVVLNVAVEDPKGSEVLGSTEFPSESVKSDFNADWGASALVVPRKTFARGFDRCMVVSVTKKRVNAFIFYLFDSRRQEEAMQEIGPIFTTLHFR
jgi:hypothetical protein